jgi:hypothetical protein
VSSIGDHRVEKPQQRKRLLEASSATVINVQPAAKNKDWKD